MLAKLTKYELSDNLLAAWIFIQRTKISPNVDAKYDKLNPVGLESQLVSIHKLKGQIKELTEKNNLYIKSDDDGRKQLKE
jgi:hypothetical protein